MDVNALAELSVAAFMVGGAAPRDQMPLAYDWDRVSCITRLR